MRLFVAIDPPDDVKAALGTVVDRLRPSAPDARWVPSENIHATVSFLGEVAEERAGAIREALGSTAARYAPVPTATAGAGAFPSARRARVLWVGLDDPGRKLVDIAGAVAAALEPLGFESERRAWTPHLTLARFRTPANAAPLLGRAVVPERSFVVARLTLFRSRLARPAPVYEPIDRFPFGA
jgi:RNA 2',3'-cyclic 3'-phosphodiesterase